MHLKGFVLRLLIMVLLGACLLFAGSVKEGLNAAQSGNYDRAYALWSPVKKQSDPEVAYYLGYMYDRGYGVVRNKTESFRWYEISAKQGFARAQFKLGMLYRNRRDAEHSVYWFTRAAEQGDSHSQKILADAYENGYGVTANDETALHWYTELYENGDPSAKRQMQRLRKKLAVRNRTETKSAVAKAKSSRTDTRQSYCASRSATLAVLKRAAVPEIVDVQKIEMLPMEIAYSSGKPLLKRTLDREGVLHERTWYENGRLRSEVSYKYGLKTGQEQTWYVDGTRHTATLYKLGRLNGQSSTWYENGSLRSKMQYKDGVLTSDASTWYVSGNKKSAGRYKTGLLEGKLLCWYDNGKTAAEAKFAYGQLDGKVNIQYDDGRAKEICSYFLGKRNGQCVHYDEKGKAHKSYYACGDRK